MADGFAEVGVFDAGGVGADAAAEAGEETFGAVSGGVAVGGEAFGGGGGLRFRVALDLGGALADVPDGVFDVLDAGPGVGVGVEVGEVWR